VNESDSVDGASVSGPGRTETEMACSAETLGAVALSSLGVLDALDMLDALAVLGAETPGPVPVSLTDTLSGAPGADTAP
jgi:hypothetical protein